ncbi:MAG: GSCFA domain-containing protein, partial [Pseudomonadota bacterium]
MERIEVPEAMARRKGQGKKYPSIEDERYRDGMMFPVIEPGFTFDMGQKIFAVGSCFARNIERQLKGFEVPTREFELPEGETAIGARNTILNEYNPGTMAQRIAGAATGASFGEKAFLEEKGG